MVTVFNLLKNCQTVVFSLFLSFFLSSFFLPSFLPFFLPFFFFFQIFIYWAVPGLSCQLQNAGSSLPHAGSFFSCSIQTLSCGIPSPGIEPGPPALGAQSLSHWPTREVPRMLYFLYLISLNIHTVIQRIPVDRL